MPEKKLYTRTMPFVVFISNLPIIQGGQISFKFPPLAFYWPGVIWYKIEGNRTENIGGYADFNNIRLKFIQENSHPYY